MNTFVLERSFSLHVKYLTYATFPPPTKRFPGVLINKELIALILIYVPARLLAAFSTVRHFRNWSNPLSNSKHEQHEKKEGGHGK